MEDLQTEIDDISDRTKVKRSEPPNKQTLQDSRKALLDRGNKLLDIKKPLLDQYRDIDCCWSVGSSGWSWLGNPLDARLENKVEYFKMCTNKFLPERIWTCSKLPCQWYDYSYDYDMTIKCLKDPPDNFNILDYITFNNGRTRSSSNHRLVHQYKRTSIGRHFYLNRIIRLWNRVPEPDLQKSMATLKNRWFFLEALYFHRKHLLISPLLSLLKLSFNRLLTLTHSCTLIGVSL